MWFSVFGFRFPLLFFYGRQIPDQWPYQYLFRCFPSFINSMFLISGRTRRMFIRPFIHRSRITIINAQSPAIFRRPLFELTINVRVCHRRYRNVKETTNRYLSTLFLIRARDHTRRQTMIVVISVRRSTITIRRFTRITKRVRRNTILSKNSHRLFSVFCQGISMYPILTIVNVTIGISLV